MTPNTVASADPLTPDDPPLVGAASVNASAHPPARSRRSVIGRRTAVTLATLAVATGGALVAWGLFAPHDAPSTTAPARYAVSEEPAPATIAPAAPPRKLSIPVLQREMQVEPMAVDGAAVLNPPTLDHAYWLSDYGQPGAGATNTTFLIGHATTNGTGVFDPLVNRADQSSTLMAGDEVRVETERGTVVYEVVSTARYDKAQLPAVSEVWRNDPHRLVLVTCMFDAGTNAAPNNLVVFTREKSAL